MNSSGEIFSSQEEEMKAVKKEKELNEKNKTKFMTNKKCSNLSRGFLWYQVSKFMCKLVETDSCKIRKREEKEIAKHE